MKKSIILLLVVSLLAFSGCASLLEGLGGSDSPPAPVSRAAGPVPAGYDGVYAVSHNGGNEDEKSMFPEEVTGLILKREGSSYIIYLANVYEDGEGEEIEEMSYSYDGGRFSIPFGEVIATGELVTLDLAPCDEGLCGFMVIGDKKNELRLARQ